MEIKTYIMGRARKAPRGAIMRVAEFLGTNHNKAARLVYGIDEPTPEFDAMMKEFVAKNMPITPKKTGPAPGKVKYRKFSR